MDSGDIPPFDDPELKDALKRALPPEQAPDSLRARVRQLCAASEAAVQNRAAVQPTRAASAPLAELKPARRSRLSPAGPAQPRRGGGLRSYAWAAGALVLVGAAAITVRFLHPPAGPSGPVDALAVPPELAADIVARHDACCNGPHDHHHVDAPKDDFKAIGRALGRTLDQSVLAADLRKDGWTFRGAAVCPVGTRRSAHLVFERPEAGGAQELSVFSLPASAWPGEKPGAPFTGQAKGHALAGVESGGALFCLVGSSPGGDLKPAALAALLDEHLSEVTPVVRRAPSREVYAELLHERR